MATKKASKSQRQFIVVLKGEDPKDYLIHCSDEKDLVRQIEDDGAMDGIDQEETYEVYALSGEIKVRPSTVMVEGWENVSW